MRNHLTIIGLAVSLSVANAARSDGTGVVAWGRPETRSAFTVGILQGGSLIGFDSERLVIGRVGLQVGAGLVGFDAGVTYHYRPGIRSRHVFLGFWSLGVPDDPHNLQMVGLTHVWRSHSTFTTQLGIGAIVAKGEEVRGSVADLPVMLLYSIGVCPNPNAPKGATR